MIDRRARWALAGPMGTRRPDGHSLSHCPENRSRTWRGLGCSHSSDASAGGGSCPRGEASPAARAARWLTPPPAGAPACRSGWAGTGVRP
eukprot:3659916-Prymnesium_polylepis.1